MYNKEQEFCLRTYIKERGVLGWKHYWIAGGSFYSNEEFYDNAKNRYVKTRKKEITEEEFNMALDKVHNGKEWV